ncbi:MAG: amylo-alpha-1,6-glucosidase [Myxococcota bacterium]
MTKLSWTRQDDALRELARAERLEWLVTNGIGGFASGTVAGNHTRRYHGLLVAALEPPRQRTVLATRIDEVVYYGGQPWDLATNRWASGIVRPRGDQLLHSFRLEGSIPVWRWHLKDLVLERRIAMRQGHNATVVQWRVLEATEPVYLDVRLLAERRGFHSLSYEWNRYDPDPTLLPVRAFGGKLFPQDLWYRDYMLARELERGLDHVGDAKLVGTLRTTIDPGGTAGLAMAADPADLDTTPEQVLADVAERDRSRVSLAQKTVTTPLPDWIQQLVRAASQFVVRGSAPTIIAGYPWFGDWGRDTMIALHGLTTVVGRPELADEVLRRYATYVDQGMLPNRFPDEGKPTEYNTVDATLWYFEAIRRQFAATGDVQLIHDLFPVLESIVEHHESGTRFGIGVDPADGLLRSGEPGIQLTWMDAKVGPHVITPRTGKCVEVNALWYNALMTMAEFAKARGIDAAPWQARAANVQAHFAKFFLSDDEGCADVLDPPGAQVDASVRPNQIFAVSLHHSPLSVERQKAVVGVVERHLWTPVGLRSLAPDDPRYIGRYEGDPKERDGAYHQGTVWAWLMGPFVEAHLRVHGHRDRAAALLEGFVDHLAEHAVGSISEIFDGDPPRRPRGAIAQAWSVAEVLRVWFLIKARS